MKTTLDPEIIYNAFDRHELPILRIDGFEKGNFAKIRVELGYSNHINVKQLQEMVLKLQLIEKNEGIDIEIINIDMIHGTMSLNIAVQKEPDKKDLIF